MSVPHPTGTGHPRTESSDDATQLPSAVDNNEATIADDVLVKGSGTTPDHTLVEPSERAEATIVEPSPSADATIVLPNECVDHDVTLADPSLGLSTPRLGNSEADMNTIADPSVPGAEATSPGIQATAGSSSVGRGWAATKGATGAAWPQPLPNAAKKPPTPPRPLSAPRAEDRYRLLDNFAHGGLGNIWRAKDAIIHREIAFKELLPKALKNPRIVERFLEEAQITGQLEHPGIVPIYDVGYQENGTPFYAMKLLKGGNMEEAIEAMHMMPRGSTERQLAFTRLLRQFIAVCQAVGFAHDKGVLHRDLKPLNVMIGQFGETLVLDWGLAKVIDVLGEQEIATDSGGQLDNADSTASNDDATIAESPTSDTGFAVTKAAVSAVRATVGAASPSATVSSGATQTGRTEPGTFFRRQVTTDARTAGSQTMMGQVMGTPAYMPSEQARGLINELDARTDIYSLGGILYKLLTNQPPVPRGRAQDVLAKVIAGQITPPREIDATIHPALEAICRKAMALQQADRYPKALDLAADVEAWLADEPVSVYPDPWQTQLRRWAKRHRTLVFSSSVAAVVLVCGSAAWSWLESNRVESLRLAAQSKVDAARTATKDSDLAKATTLLTEALGQVRAESKLSQLRDGIQSDLDNVARLQAAAEQVRLAELRTKAARLLDDAQEATDTAKDFAQARTLLTEAVTLLTKETSLADLHRQAQSRLAEVNQTLADQSEVDAAKAQFAKFTDAVEQVRVFGGDLSGEDSVDDLREAHKLASETIEFFEIDFQQPDQLDRRLTLLGPEAAVTWRAGVAELLVTIAQTETNLAIKDQPDQVEAAAKRSLERLQQAYQLGLTNRPGLLLKADLLATLGQDAEAKETLAEAESLPAKTRLDHYLLGDRARRTRQFSAAILHLQDALRVDPDDFWSLNLLGVCHQAHGESAAAAAHFTACIARRPNVVWPYLSRAIAFAGQKQFENAHRDFTRALELSPRNYEVHLNRGFVHRLQGHVDEAKNDFTTAAELRPDMAAPHVNIAEVCVYQAGQLMLSSDLNDELRAKAELQTALAELTKAILIAPQQGRIYQLRGDVQAKLAPANAIADFQRAIRLEPNPVHRAASFREIGVIHLRANRLPEALAEFDKSLVENPAVTSLVKQRAEVLLALGRNDEAVAAFTKYLEKHGPDADSYRGRSSAYAKLKKLREAINDYTMSLQYEPAPNMLKQRGKAYLLQATQLAKEDFEESLRLNPIDPDSRWGLAHAMVTLGEYIGGVAEIEKAAATNKRAVAQYGPQAWPLFFNPATTYAQASAKASVDPKLSAERREELATKYVTRAIELLTEAHRTAGPKFRDDFLQELRTDTVLNPIRQQPEFLDYLKSIEPATK